ncbi:hypothetical protein ACFOEE_05125 [Pseudoalteromonas fenneropenaei]|uniref:Toxin CptA n=1 Tax=Pseudoalteromonas fenneropenaei TaxID=1737459 RepID=A0ABV7CH14_9GAMM
MTASAYRIDIQHNILPRAWFVAWLSVSSTVLALLLPHWITLLLLLLMWLPVNWLWWSWLNRLCPAQGVLLLHAPHVEWIAADGTKLYGELLPHSILSDFALVLSLDSFGTRCRFILLANSMTAQNWQRLRRAAITARGSIPSA